MPEFADAHGFGAGMSMGFINAGFELQRRCEGLGAFGMAIPLANRHLFGDKWDAQVGSYEEWEPIDVPVVASLPPCAGFSLASSQHFRGINSPINACMWGVTGYAARCDVDVFVMESVQQAFSQGRPLMQRLRGLMESMTDQKYDLVHVKHNSIAVGGAAIRKRYFMCLTKIPFGVDEPEPRRIPMLGDVIGDLTDLDMKWESQPYRSPPTWFSQRQRGDATHVDGHISRECLHADRLAEIYSEVDWQPGESEGQVLRRYYEKHGHVPELWKRFEEKLLAKNWDTGFNATTRWDANRPARVLTGAATVQTLHPTEPRLLSYREIATVMGWPSNLLIEPLQNANELDAVWGKAVSCQPAEWIAGWVKRALDGDGAQAYQGETIGDRERLIDWTWPAWLKAATKER